MRPNAYMEPRHKDKYNSLHPGILSYKMHNVTEAWKVLIVSVSCCIKPYCIVLLFVISRCPFTHSLRFLMETARAVRDCLIRPFNRINECLVCYQCIDYEREMGHSDPILVKRELNMLCTLLSIYNLQGDISNYFEKKIGKLSGDGEPRRSNYNSPFRVFLDTRAKNAKPWRISIGLKKLTSWEPNLNDSYNL